MKYIKQKLLVLPLANLSILLLPFVQLKFVHVNFTTRPISVIFIFLIFMLIIFLKINESDCKKREICLFSSYYLNKKIFIKWIPIFLVIPVYCLFSFSLKDITLSESCKYILYIIVSFLFYWFAYTHIGVGKKIFFKLIIISSIPFFIVGIFEVVGLLFYHPFYDIVVLFREYFVSVNFDKLRLHLLFSEPSFLPTYFIMLIYVIYNSDILKKLKYILIILISIFVIVSHSLNCIIIISVFLFFKFILSNLNTIKKLLILCIFSFFCVIFIKIMLLDRFKNIMSGSDISAYIRLLHIKVMIKMLTDSYGVGVGVGSYQTYFINYLNLLDSNIVSKSLELTRNITGQTKVVPYSIIFSVIGQFGVMGFIAFLYIFKNALKNNVNKHYYFALLSSTVTALPWGLPFLWVMLGLLDSEFENEAKL